MYLLTLRYLRCHFLSPNQSSSLILHPGNQPWKLINCPNSDQMSGYRIKAQRLFKKVFSLWPQFHYFAMLGHYYNLLISNPWLLAITEKKAERLTWDGLSPSQLILPVLLGPWLGSHFPGSEQALLGCVLPLWPYLHAPQGQTKLLR